MFRSAGPSTDAQAAAAAGTGVGVSGCGGSSGGCGKCARHAGAGAGGRVGQLCWRSVRVLQSMPTGGVLLCDERLCSKLLKLLLLLCWELEYLGDEAAVGAAGRVRMA